jgi:hypothetical protein
MEFREDEPLRIAMDKSCSFSSGVAAFGVAAFFDFFASSFSVVPFLLFLLRLLSHHEWR